MKRLNINFTGHQRSCNDLVHLDQSIAESILSFVTAFTEDANFNIENCILNGCKVTLQGTQGVIDIGAGDVILNGEVCHFNGIQNLDLSAGSYVFNTLDTYPSDNPVIYAGGSQEYVHLNRICEIIQITTQPTVSQLSVNSFKRFIDILKAKLVPVDGWMPINAQGSINYPQFANGTISRNGHPVMYRKTLNGDYEFKGMIDLTNYSSSLFGIISIIDFGSIYINTLTQGCSTASLLAGKMLPVAVVIKTNGIEVGLPIGYSLNTGDYVYMSGIRAYLK